MLKQQKPAPDRKGPPQATRQLIRAKAAPTPGEIALLHRQAVHCELQAEETVEDQELERF
ncbi:hypothetical protein GMLC_18540 [Geomonas limicola]|uniref:Uncharacterized protein n=1 Tax=Geomonas limicola TaxID=2740186 RepID=A0A6V8N6R9_9BACT|nr:hypothetical protein [Geomonas limicola]GFO68275.1 hypothetical protein GMLC_18540 [Geomonas limicola]